MANIRTTDDRVLVRASARKDVSSGGIIIPSTVKDKPTEGEVIRVGPGLTNSSGDIIPLSVEPGDKILFAMNSGIKVKVDGEDMIVMKEADIMGVIS